MLDIKKIEELTNVFGPSGFEDEVVELIRKYSKGVNFEVDSMNNAYTSLPKNNGKRPVIMLDCHTDEVGFMVQAITSKGLIKFVPLGSWIINNIPAHLVKIKNSKGEYIKGITTSRPPHFMGLADREKKLALEDIFIDIGANNREEVIRDFGIEIGDPVVPELSFSYNEKNGIILGKALDNRLGCFCILDIMEQLKSEMVEVDVVAAFSTQEEVGARGSQVTARKLKPDLAIVIEGTPADDIYFDEYTAQGALNKGTQIRHIDSQMVSNPKFIKFSKEIAKANHIAYQSAVRTLGSTNAGKIHLSNAGVPTLVLGIPVRYAHTHYGYSACFDIEATINLALKVIKGLTEEKAKELLNRN